MSFANGEGVAKDAKKARAWYEKAAAQGYFRAQNNLGIFYQQGIGGKKDAAQAWQWFQKAAA